jgi:2-polyprenyl-3-methyl-5-hydroxy-6-metoxy-1,4-benzoquinol methylase
MMVQEKKFDALGYWEQRLRVHPGISGVGYLGRSPQFIEQQYRSRKQRLRLALKAYGLADLAGRSVLDVGSGTGIWLDFWHQYGAEKVVGLDFAQASVDKLTVQFPDDLIVRADMSEKSLPLSDTMRFDVISAFDVLLHIVDPDGFRRAIANLARHCAPGGWLIISDPIIQGRGYVPPHNYAEYSIVRPLAEYRDILTANGFVIDSVQAATVLQSNPLEASNRLNFLVLSTWWKATGLWGRSGILSRLLGPMVMKGDQIACRRCRNGNAPGAKVIFARKEERASND